MLNLDTHPQVSTSRRPEKRLEMLTCGETPLLRASVDPAHRLAGRVRGVGCRDESSARDEFSTPLLGVVVWCAVEAYRASGSGW